MMSTDLDLGAITLDTGKHETREEGVCLLEAAAWLAGKDHTDQPPCVSPVLGAFGRRLNDALPRDIRQQLKQFLPAMLDTAGDGLDLTRAYLAVDWVVRTSLAAWLDLAGLADHATALQELEPITNAEAAEAARPVIAQAKRAAYAAATAADADAYAAATAADADVYAAAAYAAAAYAYAATAAAAYAATATATTAAAAAVAYVAYVAAADAADAATAKANLASTGAILQADAIRLFGTMIKAGA